MNKFSVGDKVKVTDPIISGCEGMEGIILRIDNSDDCLPIQINLGLISNNPWFNPKELTLISKFENAS